LLFGTLPPLKYSSPPYVARFSQKTRHDALTQLHFAALDVPPLLLT